MGVAGDAIGAAEQALRMSTPRSRSLARPDLAGAGRVEHAATLGLDALAIGAETGFARILTELAHLNNTLTPWQHVSAVADFRTAMKNTAGSRT